MGEFDSEWEDDALWDEIDDKIMTKSGHMMKRKCMNIFGRKLCLCEFLNWIKFGTTKHRCGRREVMVKNHKMKMDKKKLHKDQAIIKKELKAKHANIQKIHSE